MMMMIIISDNVDNKQNWLILSKKMSFRFSKLLENVTRKEAEKNNNNNHNNNNKMGIKQ